MPFFTMRAVEVDCRPPNKGRRWEITHQAATCCHDVDMFHDDLVVYISGTQRSVQADAIIMSCAAINLPVLPPINPLIVS